MSFSKLAGAVSVLVALSKVSAHGTVSGIVIDGTYYRGYSPSFQYENPAPVVIGWSSPEDLDTGFVSPAAYAGSNITCHKGATPGQTHAEVKAGGSIDLQWTTWPESHHGPVLDYLANCNGPCESVDKNTLKFFKIDAGGLIDGSASPGKWASDNLIANNNTWTVKIPSDIAPGNYVLRHEIIALHSAYDLDGAQNYPQCINLAITGSGTAAPAGILATELYKDTDPGIDINIYTTLSTYVIPGPAVYTGGAPAAAEETSVAASSATSASTTPAPASQVSTSAVVASPTAPSSDSIAPVSDTIATPTPATTSTAVSLPAAPVVVISSTVVVIPAATPAPPAPVAPNSCTFSRPKHTPTKVPEIPAGTTFKTLTAWTDEVVKEIAGGNKKLLGRRHARDLAA